MKCWYAVLAGVMVCVFQTVPAAETKPSEPNSGFPAVFFAETRPVFMRIRFAMGKRDIRDVWKENVSHTFEYLDANHDGGIDDTEYQKAPWGQTIPTVTPASSFFGALTRGLRPKKPETPKPALDLENFSARYQELRPVTKSSGQAARLDNADRGSPLWDRVDADRNEQISLEELSKLPQALMNLDNDGNDVISLGELSQFDNPFGVQGQMMSGEIQTSPLVIISTRDEAIRVAERLIERYAKENQSAPPTDKMDEKKFAARVISRADTDANGIIALEEWVNFVLDPLAEIELTVKMIRPPTNTNMPRPVPLPMTQVSPELRWRRMAENGIDDWEVVASTPQSATFVLGGAKLKCDVDAGFVGNISDTYKQQFDFTDADNNNYVDQAEAQRNGFFVVAFAQMDLNGDGKIFEDELNTFVTRVQADMESRMEAIVYDQGKHLFPLLDANDDRRLSSRELIARPELFKRWDSNGDGALEREELPNSYVASFGFGQPGAGLPFSPRTVSLTSLQPIPSSAPNWFQRLDRNLDGDISPREFPGPIARFDALDTNHDGLIDAQEAVSGQLPHGR